VLTTAHRTSVSCYESFTQKASDIETYKGKSNTGRDALKCGTIHIRFGATYYLCFQGIRFICYYSYDKGSRFLPPECGQISIMQRGVTSHKTITFCHRRQNFESSHIHTSCTNCTYCLRVNNCDHSSGPTIWSNMYNYMWSEFIPLATLRRKRPLYKQHGL
jgi:hypothetical protein